MTLIISSRTIVTAFYGWLFLLTALIASPVQAAKGDDADAPHESGNPVDSTVQFEKITDEASRYHLQAILLQNSEQYDAAERAFFRALTLAPERPSSLIGLAQLYLISGKPQLARARIEQAEALLPGLQFFDKVRHHLVLGRIYLELDDSGNAETHFVAALELAEEAGSTPHTIRGIVSLGAVFSHEEKSTEAELQFEAARNKLSHINDDSVRRELRHFLLSELAKHEMANGNYHRAYRTLNDLQTNAGFGEVSITIQISHLRGKALIGMKKLDEAENVIEIVAASYRELLGHEHSETKEAESDLDLIHHMRQRTNSSTD